MRPGTVGNEGGVPGIVPPDCVLHPEPLGAALRSSFSGEGQVALSTLGGEVLLPLCLPLSLGGSGAEPPGTVEALPAGPHSEI